MWVAGEGLSALDAGKDLSVSGAGEHLSVWATRRKILGPESLEQHRLQHAGKAWVVSKFLLLSAQVFKERTQDGKYQRGHGMGTREGPHFLDRVW